MAEIWYNNRKENSMKKEGGRLTSVKEEDLILLEKEPEKFWEGVKGIGWYAFAACSSLQSIKIPESVTWIGDFAFAGFSSLQSIEIPESVKWIGNRAFRDCSSLQSIKIPDGVTEIGDLAFYCCSNLQSIKISESVKKIGGYAFKGCSSLQSIKLPDSLTEIGDEAFSGCSSLQSIEIPSSVTEIGDAVFQGCSNLTIEFENASQLGDISAIAFKGLDHFYISKDGAKAIVSAKQQEYGPEYVEVDLETFCSANRRNKVAKSLSQNEQVDSDAEGQSLVQTSDELTSVCKNEIEKYIAEAEEALARVKEALVRLTSREKD